MAESVLVFISHSSDDAELARALADLIRLAFRLRATQIRCSTVDGYRLPPGADTSRQLRQEIRETRVFIGVLTPSSARSDYVLFELGARWGADKELLPVVGCGYRASALPGPIRGLNALNMGHPAQVSDLLGAMRGPLRRSQEHGSSVTQAIDAVVKASAVSTAPPPEPSRPNETEHIRDLLHDVEMLARGKRR